MILVFTFYYSLKYISLSYTDRNRLFTQSVSNVNNYTVIYIIGIKYIKRFLKYHHKIGFKQFNLIISIKRFWFLFYLNKNDLAIVLY